MAKTVKLWDGVRIITDDGVQIVGSPADLWEVFGWDITSDPNAKECSKLITRELFCFGEIDLSAMYGGKTLLLKIIPAAESEVE